METIIKRLQSFADELWPLDFADYEKEMNNCCTSIALDIFKNSGIFHEKGESWSCESIKKGMGHPDEADYLVKKLLHLLVEARIIEQKGDDYICLIADPELDSPAELLVSLSRRFPAEGATIQWLSRAYGGMTRLLQGRAYPEDILFPWGDMTLIEELYNESPIYSFYSQLAGEGVKELAQASPEGRVKLLEIGSGTGNGTAALLNAQSAGFSEYTYSDISRSLVKKGKKRFKEHDFMNFKLFDICKPAQEQEFTPDSYDVVAGVNVLHASENAAEAIKNIRSLLKEGGSFIISEVSPAPRRLYPFMELTFGLIPSYNSYNDKESRPLSPLLPLEEWQELFLESGFKEAYVAPAYKDGSCYRGGIVIGKR